MLCVEEKENGWNRIVRSHHLQIEQNGVVCGIKFI